MSCTILRVYTRPEEIGKDGYPLAWHKCPTCLGDGCSECGGEGSAKDLVRALAGHRCVRCGHPYRKGAHGKGEWSPCDEQCTHAGPLRWRTGENGTDWFYVDQERENGQWAPGSLVQTTRMSVARYPGGAVEARWRILTVHHLTMDKADLRWWNLASLCQRCHLKIQGKVQMGRVYPWPHSEWFKPYAAGWYAWSYLGEELTREETLARLDELLALELAA
jgi:hypothetical protein